MPNLKFKPCLKDARAHIALRILLIFFICLKLNFDLIKIFILYLINLMIFMSRGIFLSDNAHNVEKVIKIEKLKIVLDIIKFLLSLHFTVS
jgi:hypothetical protein